jgi:hypothetical protein
MTRRLGVLAVAFAFAATPAWADLRYSVTISAHKSSVQSAAPDPTIASLGALLASTIAPKGSQLMVITVGDLGTRVDYPQGYQTLVPAGGATLIKPDGSIVVLDPTTKTYRTMPKPDMATLMSQIKPTMTLKRTGQFATVAGLKAELATFLVRIPVPSTTAANGGMPVGIGMSGEVWLSEQYQQYSALASKSMGGLSALGLDQLAAEGFAVRTIVRGDVFGDQEIESLVTQVAEVAASPAAFSIPADYKPAVK